MLGEVIHGYRVESALSADKGGFGDVYFAVHVDSGAEAVVKVLKPEMSAQRDIVARFFNEARAAASVHHPGVVQIHNVGYHGDRAYLLMERLRGDDLEARLAAGPLPVERALVFVRQAAGAIGAAHERGIVHRDLKPANLFIVADPDVVGGERVKVLDFGIAKLTVDAGAGKTQGVFGTPAYMSPEQCASTAAVDARADLYSLGCILYELVCGRPPFGQGGIELIAAHLRDMPPPPRAIAPWVPPAIEQVILRLLEKRPEQRYVSCAALIAAIDEASAAAGLTGTGASYPSHAGHAGHRAFAAPGAVVPHSTTLGSAAGAATAPPSPHRRGPWLGIGVVVAVAGAIVVILAMPGHRTAGPGDGSASGAGSGSVVAEVQDAGTAGSAETQHARAGSSDVAVAEIRHAGAARTGTDVAETENAGSKSGRTGVAATRDAGIAIAPADARAATAAREDVRIGVDAGSGAPEAPLSVASARDRELAERLNEEGKNAMYGDRYEEAASLFERAIALSPKAKFFNNLGTARYQMGHLDSAVAALRQARATGTDLDRQIADKLLARVEQEAKRQGITLHTLSDGPAPQRASADRAGGPASDAGGDNDVVTLSQRGKSEAYAGRYESALALFHRAYELSPSADLLLDIGTMEFQLGRCDDARRTLQRIAPIWPKDPAVAKAAKLLERLGSCR
jgi:serine/threonine-protein kinase